jgi:hypothetical protein
MRTRAPTKKLPPATTGSFLFCGCLSSARSGLVILAKPFCKTSDTVFDRRCRLKSDLPRTRETRGGSAIRFVTTRWGFTVLEHVAG